MDCKDSRLDIVGPIICLCNPLIIQWSGTAGWPRRRHLQDVCSKEWRPHAWQCIEIYDYEEVRGEKNAFMPVYESVLVQKWHFVATAFPTLLNIK